MTIIDALKQFNESCEAYLNIITFLQLNETMSTAENYNQISLLNRQINNIVKQLNTTDQTCAQTAQKIEQYFVKSIYYFNLVYRGNRANKNQEFEFVKNGNSLLNHALKVLAMLVKRSPVPITHYFNDDVITLNQLNLSYYEKAISQYHL